MYPDYGEALFWDEEGCFIGGYDTIWLGEDNNGTEIDLSSIDGLEKWFYDWHHESLYQTNHWTNAQWKAWWEKGLDFAHKVKALLPTNVDLYYFSVGQIVWKVKPEDTDDGGLFNQDKLIEII